MKNKLVIQMPSFSYSNMEMRRACGELRLVGNVRPAVERYHDEEASAGSQNRAEVPPHLPISATGRVLSVKNTFH